jgi:hypothetical protein
MIEDMHTHPPQVFRRVSLVPYWHLSEEKAAAVNDFPPNRSLREPGERLTIKDGARRMGDGIMFNGEGRIGLTFAAGVLLLAAAFTTLTGLQPATAPHMSSSVTGLGFAMPAPQNPIARPPAMDSAPPQMDIPPKIRAKQEKDLRKYRFEKLKDHAAELAELSTALKDELDKSSENVLSLEIVEKAEKIEKLAKKIQNEVKSGT